jgi:hypothetical protein
VLGAVMSCCGKQHAVPQQQRADLKITHRSRRGAEVMSPISAPIVQVSGSTRIDRVRAPARTNAGASGAVVIVWVMGLVSCRFEAQSSVGKT